MSNSLIGFIATVLLLVVIIAVARPIAGYACSARWSPDYEAEYFWFGGCKVKVNGKFMPEKNVRGTD